MKFTIYSWRTLHAFSIRRFIHFFLSNISNEWREKSWWNRPYRFRFALCRFISAPREETLSRFRRDWFFLRWIDRSVTIFTIGASFHNRKIGLRVSQRDCTFRFAKMPMRLCTHPSARIHRQERSVISVKRENSKTVRLSKSNHAHVHLIRSILLSSTLLYFLRSSWKSAHSSKDILREGKIVQEYKHARLKRTDMSNRRRPFRF